MSVLRTIARALGALRPLSDEELEDDREAVRRRLEGGEDVYDELYRYDREMSRRASKAYDRENPDPPAIRHREHGWYLPNDD